MNNEMWPTKSIQDVIDESDRPVIMWRWDKDIIYAYGEEMLADILHNAGIPSTNLFVVRVSDMYLDIAIKNVTNKQLDDLVNYLYRIGTSKGGELSTLDGKPITSKLKIEQKLKKGKQVFIVGTHLWEDGTGEAGAGRDGITPNKIFLSLKDAEHYKESDVSFDMESMYMEDWSDE